VGALILERWFRRYAPSFSLLASFDTSYGIVDRLGRAELRI
jgi:hypothetical protein